MASNITLYWGSGSIPCWRPMIVLGEKGLQGYQSKLLSFSKKEHKGEEVLKLNPRGQVPTFKDGNTVICESAAICDYLEFKYGDKGTRLLPTDPAQRARVLQRIHETPNIQKALMEGVASFYFRMAADAIDQEEMKEKKKEAREELQRWENYLKQEGDGSYAVGKEFTMADVFLFPYLAFAVRCKLNLAPFPHLDKYYKKLMERPSVKASVPPHWSEEPGKDFFTGV